MKAFLKNKAVIVVAAAVVLALVMTIVAAARSGETSPVASAIGTVFAPIKNALSGITAHINAIAGYAGEYQELNDEITALRKQIAEMEASLRDHEEAVAENERLKKLLGFAQRHTELSFQQASITARSASNWSATVSIDRGGEDDLAIGDCVITEEGFLAGFVTELGANWATVTLIYDTGTEIGALVSGTDDLAVARGDFNLMQQGKLRLSYISDSSPIHAGSVVLTSGVGGTYPAGLVIGRVDGVYAEPSGMDQYAVLTPSADISHQTQVFVVTDFGEAP